MKTNAWRRWLSTNGLRRRSVLLAALLVVLALASEGSAQVVTKRPLYVTHSAGFQHAVLPLYETVLTQIGVQTGLYETTVTKDLSLINAAQLSSYDGVAFFTTGELALDASQKQALLDFVRGGKAFIGIHSATDTFYTWPEYGELIGGYFDGHPWDQTVTIAVEDTTHPSTQHLAPAFTIADEIYQFRNWSRANVHVLMHLETTSVDLTVPGVHRQDGDFALAWTRQYGAGRVFCTALGHRPEVWQDARFQQHLVGGIRWAFADADQDGLPDAWESSLGLDPFVALGADGGSGDPDGDLVTNAQEFAASTHPRGFYQRYLAEGASTDFFNTRISVANAGLDHANVLLRFQRADRSIVTAFAQVPSMASRKVLVDTDVAGMTNTEFATLVESNVPVAVDRTMWWVGDEPYGAHSETSVAAPATTWYLAEGATHSGFNLFYLLQNPGSLPSTVQVRYLLPNGAPIIRSYDVAPEGRSTIWVNTIAGLEVTDVSAELTVTSGPGIIAERAMYLSRPNQYFAAGHESAGVVAPATRWFLAEGATGAYFDLFVLLANPNDSVAQVRATYLKPDGSTLSRDYQVAGNSRFNIWVDEEDFNGTKALADTAVSVTLAATNGVPIVVERAMWWPGPTAATWAEAHNSFGATEPGVTWLLADGDVGGPPGNTDTYILIANTSATPGVAKVTLLFSDGTPAASQTFNVLPSSRFNVYVREDFAAALGTGRGFGALVESLGDTPAQLVVERAIYSDSGGVRWAAGTNALAQRIN